MTECGWGIRFRKSIIICLQRIMQRKSKIIHNTEPWVDLSIRSTDIIGWDIKVRMRTITCGTKIREVCKSIIGNRCVSPGYFLIPYMTVTTCLKLELFTKELGKKWTEEASDSGEKRKSCIAKKNPKEVFSEIEPWEQWDFQPSSVIKNAGTHIYLPQVWDRWVLL